MASTDERFRPVNLSRRLPTARCTSWTCIAASCRKRALDATTCAITSRRAISSCRSARAHLAHRARARPGATRRRHCRRRRPRNCCRRCRIRTAGGAIPRSSCSCSAGMQSVAPALKELAARAPDWRTRLHALWTLDGLDAIERRARRDRRSRIIRRCARFGAAAVGTLARRAESALKACGAQADGRPNWNVRRQLAATIGEMPPAARLDSAVTDV